MSAAQTITGRRYDTGEAVAIAVERGAIAAISSISAGLAADDAAALPYVAPGFVDLQINGYGGQEFGSATLTAEKAAAIVRRMAAFGVTRLCPTVTTAGFEVLAHAMRTIAAACEDDADIARRLLGIHLEGPYISPIDGPRGAHPLAHCRPPDWGEFSRLQEAAGGRIRLVTLAPEYGDAPAFVERAVREGVVVAIGHTAANSAQIRAAVDAGASLSTHLGNGAHRELPRHPNYIWDQLADDRLTASMIVDGHHLPPEVVKTFWRAKTAERMVLVSDLSGMAGMPQGRYQSELCELEILDDGRLVIASQRQLLAGASRPIGDGVANLMAFAGVDLKTAADAASVRPARLLASRRAAASANGDEPRGLSVGAAADLVLFELVPPSSDAAHPGKLTICRTIVAGESVWSE